MATIHLKGKGLNDWIAYSMIQDKGPTAARRASCGPMLEAVRAIITQRRAAVMEKLAAILTKEELALLTDLQTERNALALALCVTRNGVPSVNQHLDRDRLAGSLSVGLGLSPPEPAMNQHPRR